MNGANSQRDLVRNIIFNSEGNQLQFYPGLGPFGAPSTALTNSQNLTKICRDTAIPVAATNYWIGFFLRTSRLATASNWPVLEVFDGPSGGGVKILLTLDRTTSATGATLYLGCTESSCGPITNSIPYDRWMLIALGFDGSTGSFTLTTSSDSSFTTMTSVGVIYTGGQLAGWANTAQLLLGRGFSTSGYYDGMTSTDAISCLGIYSAPIDPAAYVTFCGCQLSTGPYLPTTTTTPAPTTATTTIPKVKYLIRKPVY